MLESLFNKVLGLRSETLLKRDSNTGVSCEICEIFKNTCFEEHLPTTASLLSSECSSLANVSFLKSTIETIEKGGKCVQS